jgi:hypothetical protein
MIQDIFRGLFDSDAATVISPANFLICIAASIAIGLFLAFVYSSVGKFSIFSRSFKSSKSFLMTLCMLPAVVCVVILMVNGNLGAGVAVAGAFSLVRFRSAPGNAREIGGLFLAMAAGLICGMGYLAYAFLFSLIMGIFMLLLSRFGGIKENERQLVIVIPEDLNFNGIFEDLFDKYTVSRRLTSVKTSNMGSLFKLKYDIEMKDEKLEKEFIDELRCRNGNLEISIVDKEEYQNEL